VAVGVRVAVAVAELVRVAVAVGDAVEVGVAVAEDWGVGVAVDVLVGVADAVCVGVAVGPPLGQYSITSLGRMEVLAFSDDAKVYPTEFPPSSCRRNPLLL
jgi:hypothetical protein